MRSYITLNALSLTNICLMLLCYDRLSCKFVLSMVLNAVLSVIVLLVVFIFQAVVITS